MSWWRNNDRCSAMTGARVTGIVIASALFLHLAATSAARAAEPIAPAFDDLDQRPNREQTYAANAYTIIHVGSGSGPNEPGSWRAIRGLVMTRRVAYDEFFDSMGRHDLAQQSASRLATSRGLVGGGWALQFGSVLVLGAALFKASWVLGGVGAGMLVGGAVMRGIGSDMERPTFPEDHALDMASRYNQALRTRLGLSLGGHF
jgi:hypothetical protein